MEFKHIKDCWAYLREAENYDDLYERTQELPIWSGSWDIVKNEYNECCVINRYWDKQYETYEEDQEDLDIRWPIDDEEDM